jgi:ABC-2 type transport system ATP-binding protein
MKNAIKVSRLSRYFGKAKAVESISFVVPRGEFFGFLGPNGAGKTTTMRMLSTLLRPSSGRAWVNGCEITKDPDGVRRSIGFAMQSVTLDELASGWENLVLLGVLYGQSEKEVRKRAGQLLELMQLNRVAGSWVKNYSGGMRRRLDLAAVLMHNPPILFLDEPTEGLDPTGRRVIWDYLKKLGSEHGTTIFLTTHYMDEADHLCQRISIIDHGRLVVTDSPQKLKKRVGGSLDDVFIHYTGHSIQDEDLNTKAADPYVRLRR